MTPTTDAHSPSVEFSPTLPQIVGVLGGGRMGAGIAHAFLMAGCTVTVVERDLDALGGAHVRVHAAVQKSAEKLRTSPPAQEPAANAAHAADAAHAAMARLRLSTDYVHLAPCALVVEAVPEVVELKTKALLEAERHLDAAAVLATNTSSLSVTDLARNLARPENFLGLHFFNPVPASLLVEIVAGLRTSPALASAATGWVAALGKTAVSVQDSPGFASSRLGVALALEAMRMLEDGVAGAQDIDNAMVLGYRHQTGPLRTTDLVGLDVRLEIADYLARTLGPRFDPPQILRDKVARGELGRKSGKGFFDWDPPPAATPAATLHPRQPHEGPRP